MPDPFTITAITALVVSNVSSWLNALQGTLLNASGEIALQKGANLVRDKLHLDEKEQLRHLEAVLKQAVEGGETKFQSLAERTQYRALLANLSEPGENSDPLRREALRLFTLSEKPNLIGLNTLYNNSLRNSILEQPIPPAEIDAAPYLNAFFDALIAALYADPFFKRQMSDTLHLRLAQNMQQSLTEVSSTLRQIDEALTNQYTNEQFERDKGIYTAHMERTLHYLKLVGIVPKDRGSEHTDPELNAIFVPLRLAAEDARMHDGRKPPSIIGWLEQSPNLVLLGGPGSGKSTATRYLSWSHAAVHLKPPLITPSSVPLLSGRPLPLRIELRRLSEERRLQPDLDFLEYAVRVLLGRSGSHIKRQMFVKLLTQRQMLCLFDGLDEVATLDERRRLIDEIEDFTLLYPGNRVLVTSRPVGYDLARFSNQLFTHTHVEEFDNQQIGVFLERWYTHVLRLSPLPPDDRQELETLYTTLKDNPRLHALAANPLLLTVITALHRYERLPDRRILVYDRCADLLLDTWAKLKGTSVRWKDMKIGKEDQYACVAHLGFILHERSQEKREGSTAPVNNSSTIDVASDVPTRFMLKEIEHFLRGRRLLSETAEQRVEAKRFLDLMQIEAGLIVERGKGEDREDLYGFVHRTFQEYFAAVDVYERYQQEEDPTIISQFLHEHLHDPHWRESILLLLAKLKRRPATLQLRQILQRKSRLSQYVDILHQDLFFVCACLAEDIAVDIELAESVVTHISDLVKQAPFPSQRIEALDALVSLMRTRQYAHLGREEIKTFATKDVLSDPTAKVHAVQLFYKSYARESPERQQATQRLVEVIQREDLTIEQSIEAAEALYQSSPSGSQEQQAGIQKLMEVIQCEDLTIEQSIEAAEALNLGGSYESQGKQEVRQKLIEAMRRGNLTIEQSIGVTQMVYQSSPYESQEEREATQKLVEVMKREDLTIEQSIKAAVALYRSSSYESLEQRLAVQSLVEFVLRPNLPFGSIMQTAQALYNTSLFKKSQQYQQIILKLMELMQQEHLSIEQNIEAIEAFHINNNFNLLWSWKVHQKVMELVERADISIEYRIKAIQGYYRGSFFSWQLDQMVEKLLELVQYPSISIEQSMEAAQLLSDVIPMAENKQIIDKMMNLIQHSPLSIEQNIRVAQAICLSSSIKSRERQQTIEKLVELIKRTDLSVEQSIDAAQALYNSSPDESQQRQQATQKLIKLVECTDLSLEQHIQAVQALYRSSPLGSQERQQAAQRLWQRAWDQKLPLDQRLQSVLVPLTVRDANYADRAQSLHIVFALTDGETAVRQVKKRWCSVDDNKAQVADIPCIVDLINDEKLPIELRDEVYEALESMIPEFGSINRVSFK